MPFKINSKKKTQKSKLTGFFIVFVLLFLLFNETNAQINFSKRKRTKDLLGLNSEEIELINRFEAHLVEVEIIPIKNQIEDHEKELDAWNMLKERLMIMQDVVRRFVGADLNSPLNAMLAQSENDKIFTATANSHADLTTHKVQVLQVASPDIIVTRYLKKKEKIEPTKFTIKSGEQQFEVDFKGGDYIELARAIRKASNKIVRVDISEPTIEDAILKIKGNNPGTVNKITFSGDEAFLKKYGILKKKYDDDKLPHVSYDFKQDKKEIAVLPKSKAFFECDKTVIAATSSKLVVDLKISEYKEKKEEKKVWKGPAGEGKLAIGSTNKIEIDKYILYDEDALIFNPEGRGKELFQSILQGKPYPVFIKIFGEENRLLHSYDVTGLDKEWKTFEFKFADNIALEEIIKGVEFANQGNTLQLDLKNLKIIADKKDEVKNDFQPNYLTKARDSKVKVDGTIITRPSNIVDNAVDGVTLNLKAPSEDVLSLKITRDEETIITAISELIDEYNFVLMYLGNTTEYQPRKTNEQREKEKEEMKMKRPEDIKLEKMTGEFYKGTMDNEFAVRNLYNKIKVMRGQKYETSLGDELAFLKQIGLLLANQGGLHAVNLEALKQGFIEFDKDKFKEALSDNFQAVKDLFAYDKDGDKIPDSGFCVSLYKTTRNSLSPPPDSPVLHAFVPATIRRIKKRIKSLNDDLGERQEYVDDKIAAQIVQVKKLKNIQKDAEKRMRQLENQLSGLKRDK